MSKHTPGPWIIDDNEIGPEQMLGGEVRTNTVAVVQTPGLYNTMEDLGQEEANANLIVAAPELLVAAHAAAVFLRGIKGGRPVYDLLMVALAKAEGKS
jgi:hypothetical protein